MNSIGERLRQERLRRGLDLDQIAGLTKISPAMLEAIEADDLDRLPGSFFARSFVRQYAQALGLDEDEFEAELRRVAGFGQPPSTPPAEQPAAPPPPQIAQFPARVPAASGGRSRQSLGSLIAFVLILVACTGIYTLWQKTRSTSARSPQAPIASQTPEPAPVPAATPSVTPEAATPTPEPSETPAAEARSAETPQPTPAPAQAVQQGAIRLELRATSEAWVRVVSDGKTLFSGVLEPNQERVFEGANSMTLRAGNAGALAAVFNGKPMGELGPEGQVRTIQFTPAGFKFVTAAPAGDEEE